MIVKKVETLFCAPSLHPWIDIHSVAKSEEQTRLENIIIIIVALAVEYELIDAAVTFFLLHTSLQLVAGRPTKW